MSATDEREGGAGDEQEERLWSPGQRARVSGQYQIVDDFGQTVYGPDDRPREITISERERFPATADRGWKYRLVDATHHSGGE